MSIPIHIGKVVMSIPTYGMYILTSDETTQNSQKTVIAYGPTGGLQEMYPAGTAVAFVYMSGAQEDLGYILSSINVNLDALSSNFSQFKFYNAEKFTQSSYKEANADIKLMQMELNKRFAWAKNQANGIAGDAIAGDLDLIDNEERCGLHVGRLVAQLRGSALSFIDVTVPDNKVRIVGNNISTNTMTHEGIFGDTYSVANTAISVSEGFGFDSGSAVFSDDFNLTERDPTAIPFYRIQHAEGAPVDGKQDVILGFPDTDVHTAETEPPILSIRKQTLAGTLTDAGVRGIYSVKTPVIAGVHQIGYNTKSKLEADGIHDDLHEPYEKLDRDDIKTIDTEASKEKSKEEEAVTDAAINKLIDTLLFGEYRTTMLDILAKKGFSISSKRASILDTGIIDRSKDIYGATDRQNYPLPNSTTIKDPVTGEDSKVYDTMSFVTQEPDGSICLCDGYGSEIRMSRGNIYISPALDLFFRPGRDMSAMVGRHMSLNSQRSCTINSSDSIYMRSEKSLKVVGATSGEGTVAVESRVNRGAAGGLNILSTGSLSMTAREDLVIGRNSMESKDSVRFSEPQNSGRIIIDAGTKSGVLYMRGSQTTIDSSVTTLSALSQGGSRSGSAISITPGNIGLYGRSVQVPAVMSVLPMEEILSVKVLTDSGDTEEARLNTMSVCSIYVSGDTHIGGTTTIKGGLRVDGGGAIRYVASETLGNRAVKNQDGTDQYTVKDEWARNKKVKVSSPVLCEQATDSATASQVYKDSFVVTNSFSFPDTYDVQCDYMPGMVWQMYARETGRVGKLWEETPVKTLAMDKDTMCYPGADIWNKNMSVRGYSNSEVKINGGYPTNTLAQE